MIIFDRSLDLRILYGAFQSLQVETQFDNIPDLHLHFFISSRQMLSFRKAVTKAAQTAVKVCIYASRYCFLILL